MPQLTRYSSILLAVLFVYVYTAFRTMQFGFSMSLMFFFFVGGTGLAVLLFGLTERRFSQKMIVMILAAIFLLLVLGEAYAGIQEWQVSQSYPYGCDHGAYIVRWAPFSNHGIFCGDGGVWVGND